MALVRSPLLVVLFAALALAGCQGMNTPVGGKSADATFTIELAEGDVQSSTMAGGLGLDAPYDRVVYVAKGADDVYTGLASSAAGEPLRAWVVKEGAFGAEGLNVRARLIEATVLRRSGRGDEAELDLIDLRTRLDDAAVHRFSGTSSEYRLRKSLHYLIACIDGAWSAVGFNVNSTGERSPELKL